MLARIREWLARWRRADDAGSAGERHAAAWLEREKHFRIVARNWRAPRDNRLEIDLVARHGEALVFIEVKTRAEGALVPGYFAAVTKRKKKALLQATRAYVAQLRSRPHTIRFDVVEVVRDADGRPGEVLHFENVPLFAKEYLRGGS